MGFFLPGFKALKIFGEGMARGFLVYIKKDALLLTATGQAPIHPQGMLGGGLSFHPHARSDLAISVQRGFGDGIAPWVVSVNFLTLSAGQTYQGRAATPIAQLAADATREFVNFAVEKLQAIDPYLKKDCVLYDDNHQPTGKLGELGPDGNACIYQGLRVPIGPRFWHNNSDTRLCYDEQLTDCFLTRTDRNSAWEPIHPLLVHSDCFAYYNGQPWMRIGKPTEDHQACENQGHVIPVGQILKPDHKHLTYYCYDEPDTAKNQTKKLWCLERPEQPQSDGQYMDRRFAAGLDRAWDGLDRTGARIRQVIDEGAKGVPLHATTPVQEAVDAGRDTLARLKNVTAEDAKQTFFGVLRQAKEWLKKPWCEQAGDFAETGGDILASPSTYIPGGALLGRGGRMVAEGAEVAADAAMAGRSARRAVSAAAQAEHAAVDAARAEQRAALAARAAERRAAETRSAEGLLRQHEARGGHTLSRHVGKSDEELLERLRNQSTIPSASTFANEATAEVVLKKTLAQHDAEILAWLRSSAPGSKLTLQYQGADVIGRGIKKGETVVLDKKKARVVLKKGQDGSYFVLTAYVE